jgi:hypothetical protein
MSRTAQQRHTLQDSVSASDKSHTNRRYSPAATQQMNFGGSCLYMLPGSGRRSWIPTQARNPVKGCVEYGLS